MSMKKALTGAILAGGAILAPFAKGDTKTNNTQKPVTIMADAVNGMAQKIIKLSGAKAIPLEELERNIRLKKKTMPSWIPTTADGKFDEKKAKEQAEMLWAENGKDIKAFAEDVEKGMPIEIAYTKFAHKLANGDKEKEQTILSLFNAVKETHKERKGKMDSDHIPMLDYILVGLSVSIIPLSLCKPRQLFDAGLFTVAAAIGITMISYDVTHPNNSVMNAFVKVQENLYNHYKKIDAKKYTMTDMQTTKQMIEKAKSSVK